MEKESLEKIKEEMGLITEEKRGPGRPPGAKGPLPNLKTMTKKDLIAEAGKSRKRIKELEQRLQELEQKAVGISGAPIPSEMWAVFPTIIYDFLAARYGDHWKLTEQEAKAIGQSLDAVANRYFGMIAGSHPELVTLAMVLTGVTVPRLTVTAAQKKKQKNEKKKDDKETN